MVPTTHAPLLILAMVVVFVAVIGGTMFVVGRAIRSPIAATPTSEPGTPSVRSAQGLARTLADRGLVNATQLANMSPAEREFFLATMAAKLGDGSKPRLVPSPGAGDGADGASRQRDAATAAATGEGGDALAAAALVSGPIHCPVCRALIGQRAETPLRMSRCPGCSRRVGVRVEGDRLTVTVDYTLRTPAAGTPRVKPQNGAG